MIQAAITESEFSDYSAMIQAADSVFQRLAPNIWKHGGAIPESVTSNPEWQAVDNEIRGKVEQYRILNNPPETLVAYIGQRRNNGIGVDRIIGASYPVTVWTGLQIGIATKGAEWRVNSFIGTHMAQFYARIAGREYTGRGFGEGMSIVLRETAESKRKNPRNGESVE